MALSHFWSPLRDDLDRNKIELQGSVFSFWLEDSLLAERQESEAELSSTFTLIISFFGTIKTIISRNEEAQSITEFKS